MTVFMVVAGWDYDGTKTLGVFTHKDVAVALAKNAYSKQDLYDDACYDFVNVVAVKVDAVIADDDTAFDRVFSASKHD
jgi:hypothetical protein